MKQAIILTVILLISFIFPVFAGQEQETIKEKVTVVNVEVPVRVFFQGKPVDFLTRDDFLVYEGKKQQKINGFFIEKRKIGSQNALSDTQTRYFALNFKINDYNKELKDALYYIFDNILRENDQLLVFANDRQLFFYNLKDKDKICSKIEEALSEQVKLLRTRLNKTMHRLEFETSIQYRIWRDHRGSIEAAFNLLKVQRRLWIDYHNNYIRPDMVKYVQLANHLEKIKKQKWVINFYQEELLPMLKKSGKMNREVQAFIDVYTTAGLPHERRVMNKMYNQLEKEIQLAADFMVKDISKLFYSVDAGFHSIVIPNNPKSSSFDYQYKSSSSPIENSLRKITKDTGGALIASNNLDKFLKTIEEKETVYYRLTFAPENPEQVGRIKILTKDKNYKVIYDDNFRADYVAEYLEKHLQEFPALELSDFTLKDKELHVVVKDFLLQKGPKGPTGHINLNLLIKDRDNNILYKENKTMKTSKDIVTISIPVKFLEKGKYFIICDVKDLLTGAMDMKFIQPLVN
jgi:hypothetical protein